LQSRIGRKKMSLRDEERAFETPPISVDATLAAGLLCPGLEKRTMREPEVQAGL